MFEKIRKRKKEETESQEKITIFSLKTKYKELKITNIVEKYIRGAQTLEFYK